jgi:hypothetical protein
MRRSSPALLTLVAFAALTACPNTSGESTTDASTSAATDTATTDDGQSSTSAATADTTSEPTGTASSSSTGGSTGSSEATSTSEATTGTTGGPDPDHVRECEDGDFVCDDWGCENPPHVKPSECYKRCTPDAIGEPDAECDEPERPFCSQIGRALGGDFDCNDCTHICVSATINQCQQPIDSCAG